MLRLLLSILSILAAQALDYNSVVHLNRWTLKAAHHGISKHVDVSWEDLKQIQDRYKAHRPMQIRNTDKQWSVDHAFKFLLKHGRRFEGASIKAQPRGFDFEGTLHGTQYKLQCTHRCRVHRLGDYRDNSLGWDTHKDDMTFDEWQLHQESHRILDLLEGESIHPSADSTLNCMRVIVSQDCEAHGYAPIDNKQLCAEAMNDAVPEARRDGINIPVVATASTLEGATSPDCSTDGHVIIYNERAESVYVVADGTVQTGMGTLINWKRVSSDTPGAEEAPGDVGCSKHEPCICQYKKEHAKANHTAERVLCDDVHDDYINRTALQHPHVNMLSEITNEYPKKNGVYLYVLATCTKTNEWRGRTRIIYHGGCPSTMKCKDSKCKYKDGQACAESDECLSNECDNLKCQDEEDCHPADSIVRVQHPCDAGTCVSPRRMDQLKIGDMVESDHDVFEPIIAFMQRSPDSYGKYYEFVADNHTTLHISPGHYLYTNKKLTLPKDVQLGDIVSTGETITNIRYPMKQGHYHAYTWSAKLIVDGIQTSTHTDFIEVCIQDYVGVPSMYIFYKLGFPIDIDHRIILNKKLTEFISSQFDGVRAGIEGTYLAPFLMIFFGVLMAPVVACLVFPETLAVAAMGYYVYKQNKSPKNVV